MIKTETLTVLIKEEGDFRWLQKEVTSFSEIQKTCRGNVDCIALPYNIDIWINDDGIGQINLMLMWDEKPEYHQYLFGPVVLAGVDKNGATTSLNELQRQWIAKHLRIGQLTNGQQICVIDLTDGGAIA